MGRMILNNALRSIVNAERRGKDTVELKPISTVMSSFLKIMKDRGYVKDFQVFDPHRVGRITVQLQGRVNDCKALTYMQDVKARDIEEYKMQRLPSRQWGYVVITTPEGVLDHEEAVKRNVDLSSYFYDLGKKKRRSIHFATKIVFLYLILPPTFKSLKYSVNMSTYPMRYSLFYYRRNIFAHHLMIFVEQVILKGNN